MSFSHAQPLLWAFFAFVSLGTLFKPLARGLIRSAKLLVFPAKPRQKRLDQARVEARKELSRLANNLGKSSPSMVQELCQLSNRM